MPLTVHQIYDPVKPNICAWFSFDSSSEARQFVKAILTMSSKVDYSWYVSRCIIIALLPTVRFSRPKSTSDAGSRIPQRAVYNMSVKYRSLFVTFRRNGWHWGELYHSKSSPSILVSINHDMQFHESSISSFPHGARRIGTPISHQTTASSSRFLPRLPPITFRTMWIESMSPLPHHVSRTAKIGYVLLLWISNKLSKPKNS